jgi:NAD(P)-dependent dehydrogenase (short-subunit alcohol dehydrogenase family)
MEWRNQVAVVTGSTRGLGRATARLLAQRGAAVCVNYAMHADAAEALVAEIATAGGLQTSPTQPRSRRWSPAPKRNWVR